MAGRPKVHVVRGFAPCVCLREIPNPEPWWRELWRAKEPQESTDGRFQPGQVMGSSRNGLPGGAKLRSGRAGRLPASPVSVGTGRYVRHTSVRRGDRTSDRRDPSSWLMSPGSAFGWARAAKSWRDLVKAAVKTPQALRRRQSETNPQGSNGPREWVRLPGKGKLWRGAPGTRAVWNKTAKRRGPRRTAGSKRPRASRELAGTVERGKNPEDGTDEGLAILVPHGRPQGRPWWRRGTRRSCVRGSKNLTRGRPAVSRSGPVPS